MPVNTPKIFFSYTRADTEFALKLAKDLRSAGINLWIDQLDILPGERWDHAVETALRTCPYLLVILSPASVVSDNVMDEVSFGLENSKKIIPVQYRACEIPFRLRRLQYIDFVRDYDDGLRRLLAVRDDAAVPPPPSPRVVVSGRFARENPETIIRLSEHQLYYSLGGLFIGLVCVLGGITLFLNGVAGTTSWSAKVLGAESTVSDAAPGAVLFIVGIFIVLISRYVIKVHK